MKVCHCGLKVRARKMCSNHYEQWRRRNPLEVDNRAGIWDNPDGSRKPCLISDCPEGIFTQGMCQPHYNHFYYSDRKNRDS